MIHKKIDDLFSELNNLVRNIEALLTISADITEDKLALIRNNALDALHRAKCMMSQYNEQIATNTKNTIDCIDTYVKEKPWQSIGISATTGAILAMLFTRR